MNTAANMVNKKICVKSFKLIYNSFVGITASIPISLITIGVYTT